MRARAAIANFPLLRRAAVSFVGEGHKLGVAIGSGNGEGEVTLDFAMFSRWVGDEAEEIPPSVTACHCTALPKAALPITD